MNQYIRQVHVRDTKSRRQDASIKISALARGRRARRRVSETKQEHDAAILIQRTARGRRGRNRADQQHAARREKNAAIKIQKVARGHSKRALFCQSAEDLNDRDLYGTKSDARECGTLSGAASPDRGSVPTCEQQLGSRHSLQNGDCPKRVGFLNNPSASEEAAALVALDLDEHVRSFVVVQATVRRYEAKVEESAASRRAQSTSEKNDRDVPLSVETENITEREPENLSESDLAMSLSLSESDGQDTSEGEQEEGWKSDFALDDMSGDALFISEGAQNVDKPHDCDAETPESVTKEGKEGFISGLNQDDESEGGLAALEGGEGEEHEDQATLSERGSGEEQHEDDGASAIAAELTEVAVLEAKMALFLESGQEASEGSASAASVEAKASFDAEALESARKEGTRGNDVASKRQHSFKETDEATATTMNAASCGIPAQPLLKNLGLPEQPEALACPEDDTAMLDGDACPEVDTKQECAVGEMNAREVIPKSTESAGVVAEQPTVGEASELAGRGTAPAKGDANAAVNIAAAGSLQSTHEAVPGEIHPSTGDVLIGAGLKAEAGQPVPAVEALVEDDVLMPAADSDAANEVSAGEVVPTSAESARVSAEQPAVEATNEPESGDTEADTTTSASNADLTTSSESGKVVERGETQPPSVGLDELFEVKPDATMLEDSSANAVVTVSQ